MQCQRSWIVVAAGLLAGNLLVQGLPWLPPTAVSLAVAALAGLCLYWRRLRLPAWLVLGAALAAYQGERGVAGRLPVALEGQDLRVSGHVVGLPTLQGDTANFQLAIDSASAQGQAHPWRGTVRLSWFGPRQKPAACSRWSLLVRLRRPRGTLNPGGTDSERMALAKGVAGAGYVRADPDNRLLADAWCVDRVREHIVGTLLARVAEPHDARLLRALAVGDTRDLDDDDWRIARVTGVAHLIAISGLHIGMAALLGVWLIGGLWRLWPSLGLRLPRSSAQALGALACALPYTLLAGSGLPTVRTLLMVAVLAFARIRGRAAAGGEALALALSIILLCDPLAVLAAGFWLSFAGVAMLMFMLDGHGCGVRGFIAQLLRTQALMSLGLLPLSLVFFGQASVVGALANLLAAPWVSLVVVPLTLVGAIALVGVPVLAGPVLMLAAWAMTAVWWLLDRMASWPHAQWNTGTPTLALVLLAGFGTLWLLAPRGWPLRWLGLALLVPLAWPARPAMADGSLQVWVFDVGQGLSVLVRTRDHALLYDAGARFRSGFDQGAATVVPALRTLGIEHLDRFVVSHGDNDHAGGAAAVAAAFPEAMRIAGEPDRGDLAMAACEPSTWLWNGVRFSVWAADAGLSVRAADANDRSCVLLVEHAGGRLLIPGDATTRVESALAARVGQGVPLVLVVGHHGSRTSSSRPFIERLQPTLALVSASWRSRFGHPHADVVKRLHEVDAQVLNTAEEGAIAVILPAQGAPTVVRRWREHAKAYWRE
jgi:competence protein ComEC